jgi:hypothetical protein
MSSDFIWWAAGVIGATMAVAHAERTTLPYWPIEISRTATGQRSRFVFLLGIIVLVVVSGHFPLQTAAQRVAAAGLLLLAAVTDTEHWTMHMVGVALFAGACLSTASASALCGVGIYVARAVIRNLAVLTYEMDVEPRAWLGAQRAESIASALLFGQRTFRDARTLRYFRAAGVMQWLALLLLVQGVL